MSGRREYKVQLRRLFEVYAENELEEEGLLKRKNSEEGDVEGERRGGEEEKMKMHRGGTRSRRR